jgi:hypothetical protein
VRLYLPNSILKRAEADLSDITTAKRTGTPYWDPATVDWLVLPLDKEPTKAEADKIRRRITTGDAAEEALVVELVEARNAAKTKAERLLLNAELAKRGEPTV